MEKLERNFKIMILTAVAGATLYFLWSVREVVVPFVIAALAAYILFPAVEAMERRGINKTVGILLLYGTIFSLLGVTLWYGVPALTGELARLAEVLPVYMSTAEKVLDLSYSPFVPDSLAAILSASINHAENMAYKALQRFLESLVGVLTSVLSLIFVPILAYYLMVDWEKIKQSLLFLFPSDYHSKLLGLGREIDEVLKGFIQGHLVVCLIVGLATGFIAFLLGIKYALVIGIISGVAELFPYVGVFLGAIPAVALSLTQGTDKAVYLAIAILIIQQVEANILSPRIVGKRVGMHPLLVIFALMAGGKVFGIWGMILAVPAAATFKVLVKFLFYQTLD